MARPLTQDEKDLFGLIRDGEGGPEGGIALVQTKFDGDEAAVIVLVVEDGDDRYMTPLAVLATQEMVDKMEPPLPDMEVVDTREG